jgi:DNA-binding response OmpR family regulator
MHRRADQPTTHATVLLAEDDPDLRELLAFCFFRQGYAVVSCSDGLSLLERLHDSLDGRGEPVDLVVTDIRMPGLTGLEVLESVCDRPERPPVICMTAFGDPQTHALAERLHAAAIIDKPFDIDRLLERARYFCPPDRSQPPTRSAS